MFKESQDSSIQEFPVLLLEIHRKQVLNNKNIFFSKESRKDENTIMLILWILLYSIISYGCVEISFKNSPLKSFRIF